MDIRLRILRRIIEIGTCKKYRIKYETSFLPMTGMYSIDLHVFTGTTAADIKIVDEYHKLGLDESKKVFEWLEEWKDRIEEERKLEANRY